MSTTSAPETFVDLYTDLENRVRVETGVTATENQAKRYINIALLDMHIGFSEAVPWAERNAILITQPEYTTGTLTITQGATTITGSATLWNTANAFSVNNMRKGGKIQIDGGSETYEISSIASDTSATLTSNFTPSDVSAVSYVYFEDEYALVSDFLRPVDLYQFSSPLNIQLISRTEFRQRYERNNVRGKPFVATIIDRSPDGNVTPVRKVRFYKPSDVAYSVPYSYITSNLVVSSTGTGQASFSADADEPIVPKRYRQSIVLHALYHWYRDKKNDSRSQEVLTEYNNLLLRVVSDAEIGSKRPIIRPRVGHYVSHARKPYSRRGGRFDRGGFDQGH